MNDPRYTFTITVSSHIIIQDDSGRILMGRRPQTWEWAPGRWGLIGGKVYEHESFEDSVKRKTLQELGFEIRPEGLYQIKQLLIENKQALMIFYVAKYGGQEIMGELAEYAWFSKEDLEKRQGNEFAEFFYKKMLTEYINGNKEVLPMTKVQSLNYVEMAETDEYKEWFEGIINKSYDPTKIPDFQKWEKNKSAQK